MVKMDTTVVGRICWMLCVFFCSNVFVRSQSVSNVTATEQTLINYENSNTTTTTTTTTTNSPIPTTDGNATYDDDAVIVISRQLSKDKRLLFYWNIPTFQCKSHRMNFTVLAEKFGIVANSLDDFRGEKLAILYDPGDFPALLEEQSSQRLFRRNGGVPQAGNLTLHLEIFRRAVEELIPDANFSGLGIIDFESWRPVFRQHWGNLVAYKELSRDLVKQQHPIWSEGMIEKEATVLFEMWARIFMQETLLYVRDLRPKAKWGYYAYPYCYNMSPKNMHTQCSREVQKENERIEWLFRSSDVLYPSLYFSERKLTPKQRLQMIEGRIDEAYRVAGYLLKGPRGPKIVPYFWYKYQDTKYFLTKEDIFNSFTLLKNLRVDGVILWGSSNDVNTKQKCEKLYDFIENTLGPVILNI